MTRRLFGLLLRNPLALAGLVVLTALTVIAVAGPWLAPYDPNAVDVPGRLAAPSPQHPFGTDNLGRDVLSRVLVGARVSLQVGLVAVGISLAAGGVIGLIAGYYAGATDAVLIEGRFAEAEVFTRALASLRPDLTLYTANAHNDVSFGALRLLHPDLRPDGALTLLLPLAQDLTQYAAAWRGLVQKNAQDSAGEMAL